MIKNIILDMGNVLLDYNPQVCLDAYCASEQEKALIRQVLFNSSSWIDADQGLIKNAALYDLIKLRVPEVYWPSLKNCCEHWDICMKPIAGAKEFCEYIKSRSYGIYILSNASDKFYDYFERLLPLAFFDGVVVSSDIHMIKPNREIFEYVIEKYNLTAEECLFIDDSLNNVNAAKELGMQAHQFQNDFDKIKESYWL